MVSPGLHPLQKHDCSAKECKKRKVVVKAVKAATAQVLKDILDVVLLECSNLSVYQCPNVQSRELQKLCKFVNEA